ncbi:MAG: hypothetical protein HY240_05740 [Actinobacteria bacterium]|nr:hypothetical protein [Actinomycetota bacterium]
MAIKGKTRSKTKARTVARPPRPVPVEVKPPFFLRRWVQVSGALLCGAAAVAVLIWATNGLREDRRRAAKAASGASARRAVALWKAEVDGAMAKIGFDDQTRTAAAFTDLSGLLDQMSKGKTPDGSAASAATAEKNLKDAAGTLNKLTSESIGGKGLSAFEAGALLQSRAAMAQALQTEQQVAGLIQIASSAHGATRKDLVQRAQALEGVAKAGFDGGYQMYFDVAYSLGLVQPAGPIPAGGAPPGSSG